MEFGLNDVAASASSVHQASSDARDGVVHALSLSCLAYRTMNTGDTTTLCLKNNTDVARYNFNSHQPILVTFGRDVGEKVCYRTVVSYPAFLTNVSLQHYMGKHEPRK